MSEKSFNNDLLSFLASSSPSHFHNISNMKLVLKNSGFEELHEDRHWKLERDAKYFVVRENAALVAFTLGSTEKPDDGFRVICAHADSPCLQIKPRPDIIGNSFHQLGVEVYGGSLLAPWFDRDLSLAGQVCCSTQDGEIKVLLIDFARPILTIPNIAIHLDRDANTKPQINKQKHLPPIISQSIKNQLADFSTLLLEQVKKEHTGVQVDTILSYDIFCYDFQKPSYLGINEELLTAAKLDNLVSCHIGLKTMVEVDSTKNCLFFCSNHEENGSTSTTGAQGSFLDSVFERLYPSNEDKRICLSNSFMISMDNGHATHPNYPDKNDKEHNILLNKGPVIKINSNQRYATNSVTSAIYKKICADAGIDPQEFVMRSDMPCGSTIGPMTAARLGIKTMDVGIASLAMHSIREMTGRSDPYLLFQTIRSFLKTNIHRQVIY